MKKALVPFQQKEDSVRAFVGGHRPTQGGRQPSANATTAFQATSAFPIPHERGLIGDRPRAVGYFAQRKCNAAQRA